MASTKKTKWWILLVMTLTLGSPKNSSGQSSLELFLDSALISNPEAISIQSQVRSYQFDNQMISAELLSPKAFISSEILVSPFLNNQGKLIDTNPTSKAIGYDIGISNGGLYSLLFNLELPLLKKQQVTHLQQQNQIEVEKLKTRLSMIKNELRRSIGNMYFDALNQQVTLENNRQNATLLNEEFQLIQSLTNKGLYRISDYKLIELELKTDSISLSTSVNDFELAIRQLKAACGIQNRKISKLESTPIEMGKAWTTSSLFIRSFMHDSISTIAQQKTFDDRYLPQLRVYANSGLNSTSIPLMERHIGASAGIQLSYTLFDGHQKKINHEQQLVRMNETSSQKELKLNEVKTQIDAYQHSIDKTRTELVKQRQIQTEYKDLLMLYQNEVRSAQISVIDLIAFLKKYSEINLAVCLKEITLNKLINEYNYWNQ